MKVKMYTTHCPKCNVLAAKLVQKNIEYDEETDIEKIIEKGFQSVPLLEVDGEILNFMEAISWVNNQQGE